MKLVTLAMPSRMILIWNTAASLLPTLIGWIASCINKARLGIGDFVEIKDKEEK